MAQAPLVTTEQSNQATENLDLMSAQEIVSVINAEDHKVAPAVELCLPAIAEAAEKVGERLKKGGRLFIFGAGTSGRLGVMNAVGITEKYGLKQGQINGIIAGGDRALRFSVENSEDNKEQAVQDLMAFQPTKNDVVFGISAGGGAPYIVRVLEEGQKLGLYTIGYSSNNNAKLRPFSDTFINPVVGPEVLTGSSRMKSGSAQEMTLIALLEAAVARSQDKPVQMPALMEDFKVAAPAVQKEIASITKAVNLIAAALNEEGRVFYFGSGTCGRLGVLDASECWPTFGVEHGTVNGRIAGADAALRQHFDYTSEEAEKAARSDFERTESVKNAQGQEEIAIAPAGQNPKDIVIVLGEDSYAKTALKEAKKRGLKTIVFSLKKGAALGDVADASINPIVPEVVAPLATKFVLNTLTTASMVRNGKVLGNKMVDVAVMNTKLVDRAVRIISDFTQKSYEQAQELLAQAQKVSKDPKRHVVPVAIVMGTTGCTAVEAQKLLKVSHGLVREALKTYKAQAQKDSGLALYSRKETSR